MCGLQSPSIGGVCRTYAKVKMTRGGLFNFGRRPFSRGRTFKQMFVCWFKNQMMKRPVPNPRVRISAIADAPVGCAGALLHFVIFNYSICATRATKRNIIYTANFTQCTWYIPTLYGKSKNQAGTSRWLPYLLSLWNFRNGSKGLSFHLA